MKKIAFNTGWYFSSQDVGENRTLAHGRAVILPHTWNAGDLLCQHHGGDQYGCDDPPRDPEACPGNGVHHAAAGRRGL